MHHQKLKLAAGLQRQISEVEEQQVTPVAPQKRPREIENDSDFGFTESQ